MVEIDVAKGQGKRISYKFVKKGTVMAYLRHGMKKGKSAKIARLRIAKGKKGAGVAADLERVANLAVKNAMDCVMNQMPVYKKGAMKGSIKQKTLTKGIKIDTCAKL
jgi:hypothetical protein